MIWVIMRPGEILRPVGRQRFFGDEELVQWIRSYQPSMVISAMCINRRSLRRSGRSARSTWVFNPAFTRPPPVHIVLDIDDGRLLAALGYGNTSTSMRRCSAAAAITILRSGSYPWVGLPIRPGEILIGAGDHGLQNLATIGEVIAVPAYCCMMSAR